MEIIGTFYYPKSSKTQSAKLHVGKSSIKVFANDGSTLVSEDINSIKKNLQIFNTQSEVNFTNGASFIASDRILVSCSRFKTLCSFVKKRGSLLK